MKRDITGTTHAPRALSARYADKPFFRRMPERNTAIIVPNAFQVCTLTMKRGIGIPTVEGSWNQWQSG